MSGEAPIQPTCRRQMCPAGALAAQRLAAQQIAGSSFTRPAELVAWMGAIQAQEPLAAWWALGLRLGGTGGAAAGAKATSTAIAQALADGSVLRTHVMRWTWQLVTPADLHWMLPLVAPRLMARAARRHRELALDARTFRRAEAVFTRALADGAHRTRAELGAALRAAGIAPDGQRLPHLLGHAELQGLLCSGAPRGKQATWALLAGRAPRAGEALTRDEALAELARRYFRSRGPATAADFAWWSGLAPADARAGLGAVASELTSESIAGVTYWRARHAPAVPAGRARRRVSLACLRRVPGRLSRSQRRAEPTRRPADQRRRRPAGPHGRRRRPGGRNLAAHARARRRDDRIVAVRQTNAARARPDQRRRRSAMARSSVSKPRLPEGRDGRAAA